ncbi:hypothetical protein E1B28_003909 [Marasmius oreades]|uniref:Mediator of RNA polymerase II transcription subunit 13 n=1 Tax=Marasmius oreades TaxID=181124 RepID=A0A9P8AC95_9AGAR|nr:uncharacterized protein E1B28_003909 [Marasmius oreades]KAG7096478.1 hypothetical protein E1B28_003909 [Marasmius oreades]
MVLNIDSDGVLAAELEVPTIAYAVYTSTSTAVVHNLRSRLLQINAENGLHSSFIHTVQVTTTTASLYAFRILQAAGDVENVLKMLRDVPIDGVQLKEGPAILKPRYLYPCSEECSYLPEPCSNCLNPASTSSAPPPLPSSSASRLPRRPFRDVWAKFLDAVRERIIGDIVKCSTSTGRTINRLKNGFLLGQVPSKLSGTMTEWAAGWESRVKGRSLVYTHIHIHLSGERILIHPTLASTPFIPLTSLISRNHEPGESLQQGVPITLLPYATPAHFLSTYTGPTSALTKQFREVFQGCGISLDGKSTSYIIAWVPVENKNGEEKGLTVIYPAELCMGFAPTPGTIPMHSLAFRSSAVATSPSSAVPPSTTTASNSFAHLFSTAGPWTPFGRAVLPTIPTLPVPLQPSPTVVHVLPPGSNLSVYNSMGTPSPSAQQLGRETLTTGASYMPTPPTTSTHGAGLLPASATATHNHNRHHSLSPSVTIPFSPYPPSLHPAVHALSSSVAPLYASPFSVIPSDKQAVALSRAVYRSFLDRQHKQRDALNVPTVPTSLPKQPDIERLLMSAQGIGGYIDAIAKVREKERERLRLGGAKGSNPEAGGSTQNHTQSSQFGLVKTQAPILNQQPVPYPSITTTSSPVHLNSNSQSFPPPQQQLSQQQTFYPSPPEPPGSHTYVPSGVSPAQSITVKKEEDSEMIITSGNEDGPSHTNGVQLKDEERMIDDEDLFGASPPVVTEDVPVEPTTDPPDPVPPPPVVPKKEKSEPESGSHEWGVGLGDDRMDMDGSLGWGNMGSMGMDFDLDMGMGGGMDIKMDMDIFDFGTSSVAGPVRAGMRGPPPPPPPPPQTSAPQGTSSMITTRRSSTQSVTKRISFEDDITDDDYNWFDTHDSGSGSGANFMGGITGGATSVSTTGTLDAGATLFSSIHPSSAAFTMAHPSADSYGSPSTSAMHPPPVPLHAFGFTPSPGTPSNAWPSSHTHVAGTPSTPGIPPDMFPLSPPEEGGTGTGIGPMVGTPMSGGVGTPRTPTTTVNVGGGATATRWEAGWGVQLESPFNSPTRKPVSIRGGVDGEVMDEVDRRSSLFDAIPFAASHRVADGKYMYGKFMMHTPPLDSDLNDGSGYLVSTVRNEKEGDGEKVEGRTGLSPALKGLRMKYDTKTDPWIAVVTQLKVRGVKRKLPSTPGLRNISPRWVREWEDGWKELLPISPAPTSPDSGEDRSDDDDLDSDDEGFDNRTGSSSPVSEFSRPSTPVPHYVPKGPSLVSTQFHHALLLPLSSALRNGRGSHEETQISIVAGGLAAAAASVPTPVSPAAMMGAASEKSKSLEAAAEMVAKEVVENGLWGLAWRETLSFGKAAGGRKHFAYPSMTIDSIGSAGKAFDMGQQHVSVADVNVVKELLSGVKGLQGPLLLTNLFESGSFIDYAARMEKNLNTPPVLEPTNMPLTPSQSPTLAPLEPPLVSVGKGNTVIDILPSGLPFWEKLGLGPKHGEKNVTAFVLFEDHGEWRRHQAEVWLSNLATLYRSKNLGQLVPGTSSVCSKDGLVPLRFDSAFRKTLASFVASLSTPRSSFVFFIIIPTAAMSLSSPVLRQVSYAVKKAAKTYSEAQILFQFIPEELLLGNMDVSSPDDMGTHRLCCSVYDRVLQPVERAMSRRFFDHGLRVQNYFEEPAVTLSRSAGDNKVTFMNKAHTSLGVLDRHTLLHVAYQVSHCKKWLVAACVDQRGEAHDLGVWSLQTPDAENEDVFSEEMYIVNKVWDFAMQFAGRADVEWRIVFAKLGSLNPVELDAWTSHLATSLHSIPRRTPIHASVVSIDSSSPWIILPTSSKPTSFPPVLKTSMKPPPLNRFSSMPSKPSSKNGNIYVDGTMTTYALYHRFPLSSSVTPTLDSIGITCGVVVDDSLSSMRGEEPPHTESLLPLCSATLARISSRPSISPTVPWCSATSSRMFDIHLMYVAKSRGCTYSISHHSRISSAAPTPSGSDSTQIETNTPMMVNQNLLRDIVNSYHCLSFLSSSRMQLSDVSDVLPFHLGAVDAMSNALNVGKGSVDGYD